MGDSPHVQALKSILHDAGIDALPNPPGSVMCSSASFISVSTHICNLHKQLQWMGD